MAQNILINTELVAAWLKDHDSDNYMGNMILDALESLYGFETELAKQFNDGEV